MELPINIVTSKYAVQIYLMVILEHNSKIELELAYVLCGVCVCICILLVKYTNTFDVNKFDFCMASPNASRY